MNIGEMRRAIEEYPDFKEFLSELEYTSRNNKPIIKEFEAATGIKVEYVTGYRTGSEYDEYHLIAKFNDIYVRFSGYYSSYDGTDIETTFKEVKPVTKEITVWE